MEDQEKKQERSFELRSEKVRSIVGQIPSSLVRYGITAIGAVLLCLLAVAYFLPYKQVDVISIETRQRRHFSPLIKIMDYRLFLRIWRMVSAISFQRSLE